MVCSEEEKIEMYSYRVKKIIMFGKLEMIPSTVEVKPRRIVWIPWASHRCRQVR